MVAQIVEHDRPWAYDDLADLPDDGNRYEILQGELIVSPAPTLTHQTIQLRLSRALAEAVEKARFGTAFSAPADVVFSEHNVVEPDVFAVSVEQYGQVSDRFVSGAPAFAIEVVSPGSAKTDRQRKATLYMENGVKEYWIVEPAAKRILVHIAGETGPRIVIEGSLQSALIPTLSVTLDDLFAPILNTFD